jgi:hypothetical protein
MLFGVQAVNRLRSQGEDSLSLIVGLRARNRRYQFLSMVGLGLFALKDFESELLCIANLQREPPD